MKGQSLGNPITSTPTSTVSFMFLLLLLTVVHLTLAGVKEGQSCKDEFLFSVANKTDGLEITLFPKNDKQMESSEETFFNFPFPGQFLSPECGEYNFRCTNLVKLFVGSSQHIVFVPLLHGLFVLDVGYDGTEMKIEDHFTIEIEICSPTAVIEIFDSVYTVCVNQSTKSLKLYEIRLDTVPISNMYLSAALAHVSLTDPPNLSNFVYASLDQDSHSQRIYFTTSSSLYELIPISIDYSQIGDVDPCSSVESLLYHEWTLLAHCKDNVFYFDLEEKEVIDTENLEDSGQLYLCPDSNIDLRVFPSRSYIEFGFKESDTEKFYELPGSAYHSGLCFGTENSSFLAYRDSQDGVYVFNLQTSVLLQLSSVTCPASECKPLLVTDNNYLVVQKEDGVTVWDREKNFSQIITAQHIKANLLTVITRDYPCPSGYSPSSTPEMNHEYSQRENDVVTKVAASAASVSTVVIAAIVTIVTLSICVVKIRRNNRNIGSPTQETTEDSHPTIVISNSSTLSTQTQVAKSAPENDDGLNSASANGVSATAGSSPAGKHMSTSLELKNLESDLAPSAERHSTPVTDKSESWELEPGQLNLPTAQTKETCV